MTRVVRVTHGADRRPLVAALLGVVVVAGSVVLVASPAFWLLLLAHSGTHYGLALAVALAGCPLTLAALVRALAHVEEFRTRAGGRPAKLLEPCVVVAVVAAIAVFAVWLLVFRETGASVKGPFPD